MRRSLRHPAFLFLQRGLARLRWILALTVLAVAATLLLPPLVTRFNHDHSPQALAAEKDMQAIAAGLERYRQDNGRYPSAAQGLLALVIKPTRAPVPGNWPIGGYVDRLPRDPWGNSYQYGADDDGTSYELYSFGQAGPDGGADGEQVIRQH
ncbi:type II secretion system major pseudopilin GspG [Herbaspirillum huttiense F1]|jgi:general secretion pathway protein G|uniref:Type II secretion system major pseudopilin GspG n=1 Tax=Herbaspirillum huttiense subsp. lycopersici TaxID=3074428 RepID=A0ABU2EUI1_9BURK|nr:MULTISPECIES: type II secretion system major pseudopilin GspG [Herbaspirillum]MDR6741704.1 general secretion pathway protein G [Herbaspirillum sp. 1173]MDR9851801.1 type II secretion system major pseudopilin GspG [Herbaspirillum huttiense SE1]MDT0358639.1 type II secretion system major pseudopilin GspG [Herbaspirillum huttiense F1]